MPFGIKYEELDDIDFIQKAELLHILNPQSFETRMKRYARVVRILQLFGYYRYLGPQLAMIKDNEPNVIFFKKNRFSAAALDDIPKYIQFAIFVYLSNDMDPETPISYDTGLEVFTVLSQTSIKVKRRIEKNLMKFLYLCEYYKDGNYLGHERYPPIYNYIICNLYLPQHIIVALYGYFVVPKLRGHQMRMAAINIKKKINANERRTNLWLEQVKRQRKELQEEIENNRKEDEDYEKIMNSGF